MKKITGLLFLAMLFPLNVLATGGAIISNGTIQMGVHDEGHLNVPFPGDPLGIGSMGLRYVPTGAASTEPGCLCEGWGVGDSLTGRSGYANESTDGGTVNIVKESFDNTASTATCVVRVVVGTDNLFRVTHAYRPSPVTGNLYQVDVTVENISDNTVNLVYRRVMDWDIYPTAFEEFVTISHFAVGNLFRTSTNGFDTANPLSFDPEGFQLGPVTDVGPDDHGALFDFDFGLLASGATKTFTTFYGAAGTEADAFAALVAVGAEIYSFGQPSTPDGPTLGTPNTFIFAFKGIGAPQVGGGPSPTLDLQNGGMGAGWFGSCGMVVGRDGNGPISSGESAGMIALYFALLLLPVGILKLVHGKKRFPVEKAGIVALFLVASMLVASSAHAVRLIAPKAQRFHPTTDGQGALTVDTDQPLCPGQFNFGLTLSGAKKPLDVGDIHELTIEKVVVDELYTADLTAAYGITPDITLGLDVPIDFSRDNLNFAEFLRGNTGVRDDVFHLGDIRLNAKFRVLERARYGLALIPFANFATGDKDFLLSEGKFGFGVKVAGHYDVSKPLTLYANLGAEHIGNFVNSDDPEYYTPWIQYGVGAKYLLPWRKDHIVAEVNGETSWATPFRHSTLSPLEVLAAYRTEVAPGWTLQAGGGGGLNKGMGAPQWRAILGIAYKM